MTRGSTSSDVLNARARLQSVKSQLVMSEANLEQVSADTERTVSLADQGVASKQDRDRAVAALKSRRLPADGFATADVLERLRGR